MTEMPALPPEADPTPTPTPEEPPLDIHKPKPVHNWREFLSEIGVIVIGVLIALGAEQTVEWVHWQQKVIEAREAVHDELKQIAIWAAERRMVQTCSIGQLDAVRQVVIGGRSGASLPIDHSGDFVRVVRVPIRPFPDAAWRGTIAEGAASHLPSDERLLLNNTYSLIDGLRDNQGKQLEQLSSLAVAAGPAPLDAASRVTLLRDIAVARNRIALMGLLATQIFSATRALGVVPRPSELRQMIDQSGTIKRCKELGYPVGDLPLYDVDRP